MVEWNETSEFKDGQIVLEDAMTKLDEREFSGLLSLLEAVLRGYDADARYYALADERERRAWELGSRAYSDDAANRELRERVARMERAEDGER